MLDTRLDYVFLFKDEPSKTTCVCCNKKALHVRPLISRKFVKLIREEKGVQITHKSIGLCAKHKKQLQLAIQKIKTSLGDEKDIPDGGLTADGRPWNNLLRVIRDARALTNHGHHMKQEKRDRLKSRIANYLECEPRDITQADLEGLCKEETSPDLGFYQAIIQDMNKEEVKQLAIWWRDQFLQLMKPQHLS